MTPEILKIKKMLLDRKSWIDALQKQNDNSLKSIRLLNGIDDNYIINEFNKSEVSYQEMLIHLRSCHINPIESNVTKMSDVFQLPNNVTAN